MSNYKSVQDLIIKAAMYDKVTTTISPDEICGGMEVLRVTFQKNNRYVATHIDMLSGIKNHEEMALYACRSALRKLLWDPYEDIKYKGE